MRVTNESFTKARDWLACCRIGDNTLSTGLPLRPAADELCSLAGSGGSEEREGKSTIASLWRQCHRHSERGQRRRQRRMGSASRSTARRTSVWRIARAPFLTCDKGHTSTRAMASQVAVWDPRGAPCRLRCRHGREAQGKQDECGTNFSQVGDADQQQPQRINTLFSSGVHASCPPVQRHSHHRSAPGSCSWAIAAARRHAQNSDSQSTAACEMRHVYRIRPRLRPTPPCPSGR